MIDQTLRYIAQEVNKGLDEAGGRDFLRVGNIARIEDPVNEGLRIGVVMSLVNIEEEKTLKNSPHFVKTNGGGANQFQPAVYLNLYLLFSCPDDIYDTALSKISKLIGFFQQQHTFSNETANVPFPPGLDKVTLEMYSMNLEQMNHLWGILGGKYLPSVMYKVRLTTIQETLETPVKVVETVEIKWKNEVE